MEFIHLIGPGKQNIIEVNRLQFSFIMLFRILLIVALVKYCIRQNGCTLSQSFTIGLIRVPNRVVYYWDNLARSQNSVAVSNGYFGGNYPRVDFCTSWKQ